jgi:hypothetical protein
MHARPARWQRQRQRREGGGGGHTSPTITTAVPGCSDLRAHSSGREVGAGCVSRAGWRSSVEWADRFAHPSGGGGPVPASTPAPPACRWMPASDSSSSSSSNSFASSAPPPSSAISASAARCSSASPPSPIDAPCPQCLRHGDPMHAQERLTAAAVALRRQPPGRRPHQTCHDTASLHALQQRRELLQCLLTAGQSSSHSSLIRQDAISVTRTHRQPPHPDHHPISTHGHHRTADSGQRPAVAASSTQPNIPR